MRCIGLDIHRDFCEVAIAEEGRVRSAGRIGADPASLAAFGATLRRDDVVTLEAIGNALAMARILEPHARVVLANPKAVRGLTVGRAKTDKIDARALASLLAGGFLPTVWTADEPTAALRRQVTRRAGLVRERTRSKNQIHAALVRNLTPRQPMSDLFGRGGLTWLAAQELPLDEREAVDASLRQIAFLDAEIATLDRALAGAVLASADMQRLFTLPGVNAVTAATLVAAVGDVARFPTPRHLVSYLGLNPTVRQSGNEKARHGRISKQGAPLARHVLVEAAWHAARTPGPLRAFWQRVAAKRGGNIATVAVARKLTVIAWHLLSDDEEYAFARPSLVREKLRRLELLVGAERRTGQRGAVRVFGSREQHRREQQLAIQAESAYRRLMADWQPKRARAPQRGAHRSDATASAARQASAPDPAL